MHAELETLFKQVLQWYEKKKGALPIKPELRVFSDLKTFVAFAEAEQVEYIGPELDGVCILRSDRKIIIAMNPLVFERTHLLTQAYCILHELEHVREQTANGVMTFHLIERPERTKEEEIRVSHNAFDLALEFTGFKMPRIIYEHTKQQFVEEYAKQFKTES